MKFVIYCILRITNGLSLLLNKLLFDNFYFIDLLGFKNRQTNGLSDGFKLIKS